MMERMVVRVVEWVAGRVVERVDVERFVRHLR